MRHVHWDKKLYGNCLCWALWLWWRGYGKVVPRRQRGRGRCRDLLVPHWWVVGPDGERYHFRLVRDFLPAGLDLFLFEGRLERKGPRGKGDGEVE